MNEEDKSARGVLDDYTRNLASTESVTNPSNANMTAIRPVSDVSPHFETSQCARGHNSASCGKAVLSKTAKTLRPELVHLRLDPNY